MMPLISVIIPTYKRASYLVRAVESVLNQSYPSVEVIVVDDNEPDSVFRTETQKMMELYKGESRVRYILHPKNQNGAAARNTGIKYSCGELLCFLDDDDWYLREKLEKQFNFMQQHPQYASVYCGWERNGKKYRPYKEGDLSFELLSGTDIIYTNTIMIRREKAVECGGWDERFRRNQEAAFLLRLFSRGEKIGVISDVLVRFDTSDGRNRSKPVQFEKDFQLFLKLHQAAIERCSARYPDAREMIYSYRYRGVFLNYIKYGRIIQAFSVYRKMSRMLHKRFRKDCFLYIKRRFTGQNVFCEFEKENPFI